MKQKSFVQRIFALFIAFSCLSLLLSGNGYDKAKKGQFGSSDHQRSITSEFYRFTVPVCTEELLSPEGTRITQSNASGVPKRSGSFDYCFKGSSFILLAAVLIFTALYLVFTGICCIRRFIIKYIHDQDGYKINPSYYWKAL